jgi:hypothetical protein
VRLLRLAVKIKRVGKVLIEESYYLLADFARQVNARLIFF